MRRDRIDGSIGIRDIRFDIDAGALVADVLDGDRGTMSIPIRSLSDAHGPQMISAIEAR